jgi:hypothetical protein
MSNKTDKELEAPGPLSPEVEERMRRYLEPDGHCLQCGRPANRYHPTGPITITVSAADTEATYIHEFCEWRCYARWVAGEAGGVFTDGGQN